MEESTQEIVGGDVIAEQIPGGDGGEAVVYKKGAWSKDEDEKLRRAVDEHGLRNWVAIEKYSGLARPAKNCRLRWLNYLRPNLKKYPFTEEEEQKILHLHAKYGNSWSRIAAKLPGRSDNDIKNFWHKRAKKCQKHHLPIYPPTVLDQQDYNTPTHTEEDVYYPRFDNNNPDQTLSYVSASTSIYSTQTPISTPKPNLLPETPTSQNPILSPHQTRETTEMPFTISDATPQIQDSWQERKPPVLSCPQGRFRRFTGARAQSVSALQNTDSSVQLKCSLAMESPKTPLKLKLSPGIPAVYSVTATDSTVLNLNKNSHTSELSSSEFQLKSPSAAPLSPLHLRLSIPVPSDSSFKSNLPIPDPTVEMSSSTSAVSLPSPRLNPELPPIPPKKPDPGHDSSFDAKTEPPSIQFHAREVQSDSNLEILDELKVAQERVRILKKQLRQSKVSNKRTLPKESSRKECFSSETGDLTGSGNSSLSTGKYMLKRTEGGIDNMIGISNTGQFKRVKSESEVYLISNTGQFKRVKSESEVYLQDSENSETRTLSDSLQIEQDGILTRRNSMAFQEQMNSLNVSDHNSQNNVDDPNSDLWCSSLESLFCESSNLVHDTFSIGDLFDQKSGDGHQFTYPEFDEGGFYSNSFGQEFNSFGKEFSHSPERKFAENALMDQYLTPELLDSGYSMSQPSPQGEQFTFQTSAEGNSTEESKPCDPSLPLHQNPGENLLDSSYLVGHTTLEHGVQPYSFQNPSEGFFGGGFSTEKISSQTWKQEPTRDQSLTVENLWSEEQMVPQEQKLPTNRNDSVVNPSPMTHSMESNDCSGESSNGHAGEVRKQELGHDDKNSMPDDLSSLLEFFPTSRQAFEWYNNGEVFPDTHGFDEFDMHLILDTSSASMLTIADYM